MAANEFHEWMAYDRLYPFGDERADWRAGMISSVLANVHRGKGGTAAKPSDFMLQRPKSRRETESELRAALKNAGRRGA